MIHRLAVLVGITTAAAACAAQRPGETVLASRAAIESLVGEAKCDADDQCRTIGVGAKACGGPARYLAWSIRQTDADSLHDAVERDARQARSAAEAAGIQSTCSIAVDPGAYCARPAGECRLRSGAPPRGQPID